MDKLKQNCNKIQNKYNKELKELQQEEQILIEDLTMMFKQKDCIEEKIQELCELVPTINVIESDAKKLVSTLNIISKSSEKISGKIRQLDVARNRVDECLLRVNDFIDLEVCAQGVQQAILEFDYEKGAAHIHRFLSMDQSLLKRTANDMNNVSSMLKSVRTLQEASAELRAIVEHKFAEAVNKEELPAIERYVKLFPLLGMHEKGITEFCTYLRSKIANTAEKNLKSTINTPITDKHYTIIFADTLTLLFEGLARVIDTHQALLETYYGPGQMLLAITILQKECDIQIKRILSEWNKTRQVDRKIQQFMDLSKMSSTSSFSKIERIDPKDIDILIGEITLMHFRCELYIKFIQRKARSDIEIGIHDSVEKEEQKKLLDQVILNSALSQSKHDLLSYYLQLEQYFMEESVAKAINMDSIETNQQTSSMVDDAFFIVKKCIKRSISSGSLDGICVIINNACRVLENDYCAAIKMKLKQGYPSGYLDLSQAYSVLQHSIQQRRLQQSDTEQSRMAFIVALNNADISTEYITALCDNVLREVDAACPNMNTNDKGKLESCLSGISSVNVNLSMILDYGFAQLKSTAVKPRINPWVENFLNYSHSLTEDELLIYEAGESFVQSLILNLDGLLSSFKEILTGNNYEHFVLMVTSEITQRLEKVIMKSRFNRLGGLILDKEVRSLASYITSGTYWSIREHFARITQIATLLNFDQLDEIYDYWGNVDGALTWRLTKNEIKSILNLRIDFRPEHIKRLIL